MSEKTETGQICSAAGDPCIVEVRKPSDADIPVIARAEVPEIKTISEDALSSKLTPLDDNKISHAAVAVGEGDVAIEPTQDKAKTSEQGTIEEVNNSVTQDARFINLKEEVQLCWALDEVQKRTGERDNFERKLTETEKKLAALQAAYDAATSGKEDEMSLRRELGELKNSLAQSQAKLNDRSRLMANQDNQINALTKQVSSLKEVVAITKNLLEIRNMEVKHLQNDVDSMENRITAERDRHNAMLKKMDAAVRLNADLKTEYETQLRLFQDLRGKYEEKVTLLTAENKTSTCAVEQTTVPPSLQ